VGGSLAWRNSNASLSLSFPVPGLCLSEGKRNCFSMNLDVSFVDRFLRISDFEASIGRIIFNFRKNVEGICCCLVDVLYDMSRLCIGKTTKKRTDVGSAPDEI